jgi:murein DD-endopeptidase MepM/ murein hydrolase activator NlpD
VNKTSLVLLGILGLGVLCGGSLLSAGPMTTDQPTVPVGCGTTVLPTQVPNQVGPYGGEQITNAAVIVNVGHNMNVPPRGWVIAVATAMQESNLINVGNLGARNDHDSLGLFQQRPSQGWGTPEQIMQPTYAAGKFYGALLGVPRWPDLPLTVAAQQVQRSAFPDAYAKHERLASQIVDAVSGGASNAGTQTGTCAPPDQPTAGGWVRPVPGHVISGFRTPDRPTHYGVDLQAARQTAVGAAAGGKVTKVRCDQSTLNTVGSCDRDGSPNAKGCGWFVEVTHADQVITRYCHMVKQPIVSVGQIVAAGQQLGWSGSSGNSSGPHVHFEVHLHGDTSNAATVDPVAFMRERGVNL